MSYPFSLRSMLALASAILFSTAVHAQDMTLAATPEDREAFYNQVLDRRVQDILDALALKDADKTARVRNVLLLQYRSLRARDEAIQARLVEQQQAGGVAVTREDLFPGLSKPLHDWFVGVLALELTPEQLETVKDKMTYNKVKVTFDAYCDIIPNLTDSDKARIIELLKAAREEAICGGSAGEKSEIFQKFKNQINAYLDANGHNVAQAYKDWEAKQAAQPQATASK